VPFAAEAGEFALVSPAVWPPEHSPARLPAQRAQTVKEAIASENGFLARNGSSNLAIPRKTIAVFELFETASTFLKAEVSSEEV